MPHVTFIHGICNKPTPDELIRIWRASLQLNYGINLGAKGVSSSMVYWADVLYEEPQSSDQVHESVGSDVVTSEKDEDLSWRQGLSEEEDSFIESFSSRLHFDQESPEDDQYAPPEDQAGVEFERVPIPWFLKRRMMKVLLRDVHHYLFNTRYSPRPESSYFVQDEIRQRFIEALKKDQKTNSGGKHIVISHSMGTVIAYDCLMRVSDCPPVDALITVGSPLGLDEIQDKMKPEWTRKNGFPYKKVLDKWINVFDKLDPVAGFDPNISNDYKKDGQTIIKDIHEPNYGAWRHDISKYLAGSQLRESIISLLNI